jgi:hypothetical protein
VIERKYELQKLEELSDWLQTVQDITLGGHIKRGGGAAIVRPCEHDKWSLASSTEQVPAIRRVTTNYLQRSVSFRSYLSRSAARNSDTSSYVAVCLSYLLTYSMEQSPS